MIVFALISLLRMFEHIRSLGKGVGNQHTDKKKKSKKQVHMQHQQLP